MIDELFPPLPIPQRPTPTSPSFPNFTFSERTFYIILWNGQQCVVWIEVVVFTHLTKVTWRSCHCRQTGGFTPLSPLPLLRQHTPSPLLQVSARHWRWWSPLQRLSTKNSIWSFRINIPEDSMKNNLFQH